MRPILTKISETALRDIRKTTLSRVVLIEFENIPQVTDG